MEAVILHRWLMYKHTHTHTVSRTEGPSVCLRIKSRQMSERKTQTQKSSLMLRLCVTNIQCSRLTPSQPPELRNEACECTGGGQNNRNT